MPLSPRQVNVVQSLSRKDLIVVRHPEGNAEALEDGQWCAGVAAILPAVLMVWDLLDENRKSTWNVFSHVKIVDVTEFFRRTPPRRNTDRVPHTTIRELKREHDSARFMQIFQSEYLDKICVRDSGDDDSFRLRTFLLPEVLCRHDELFVLPTNEVIHKALVDDRCSYNCQDGFIQNRPRIQEIWPVLREQSLALRNGDLLGHTDGVETMPSCPGCMTLNTVYEDETMLSRLYGPDYPTLQELKLHSEGLNNQRHPLGYSNVSVNFPPDSPTTARVRFATLNDLFEQHRRPYLNHGSFTRGDIGRALAIVPTANEERIAERFRMLQVAARLRPHPRVPEAFGVRYDRHARPQRPAAMGTYLTFVKARNFEGNCAICMEDYEDNDMLRALPCTHLFHQQCISEWLSIKSDCPTCRAPA